MRTSPFARLKKTVQNFQILVKDRIYQKKLSNHRNKSRIRCVYNMRTQILKPEAR